MDVHVAHGSHVREPKDARAGGTRLAPSRKTPSAHSPLRPDRSPVLTVVGPDSFLLRPHVLPLGLGEVRVLPSLLGPPQALGNILPAEEAPSRDSALSISPRTPTTVSPVSPRGSPNFFMR